MEIERPVRTSGLAELTRTPLAYGRLIANAPVSSTSSSHRRIFVRSKRGGTEVLQHHTGPGCHLAGSGRLSRYFVVAMLKEEYFGSRANSTKTMSVFVPAQV